MRLKGSIVIAFSGRRYLMVRHAGRAWEFPGGRPEGRETPLETAKREFLEETGLEGSAWKDRGVAELANGDLALFSCRVMGKPRPGTDEIAEARYFHSLPFGLSFDRPEYFRLLRMAGLGPKPRTDYDAVSRDFDIVRSNPQDEWTAALMRWSGINSGSRVLDIGCGTGRFSIGLNAGCGAGTLGVDYSGGMLSKANVKARGIWARGDAARLPVADGKFDAAVMMLVLHHVDDEVTAMSEAWRALKPSGRLVIGTVSQARIRRHIMRHFPGLVDIDLARFMSVPEMKWHLRSIGFEDVHSHVMRSEPVSKTVESVVARFRDRYMSTLALVPEEEFERSMTVFEARMKEAYGSRVDIDVDINFVGARKP